MDNPHYNRIKVTSKRAQNVAPTSPAEYELVRPKVKTEFTESVEQLYNIAKHPDVNVRKLLVTSK